MLKLIFSEHQQKNNGIPDVNKFNCFISNEKKPKELLKAQKAEVRKQQLEYGDEVADEEEEEDDWMDPRSGYYVNPYVNLYNYETTMHVAVRKGNLEMIKLLLIYGADISLCNVKTKQGYSRSSFRPKKGKVRDGRSTSMRSWYDGFMAKYNETGKLAEFESVKDVFQILKEAKVEEKVKKQIKKIFVTKSIWFPDMIELYPNNMGHALSVIMESLSDDIPEEIINIIIEYFYNIVEQDAVKEANQAVDITNEQRKNL